MTDSTGHDLRSKRRLRSRPPGASQGSCERTGDEEITNVAVVDHTRSLQQHDEVNPVAVTAGIDDTDGVADALENHQATEVRATNEDFATLLQTAIQSAVREAMSGMATLLRAGHQPLQDARPPADSGKL